MASEFRKLFDQAVASLDKTFKPAPRAVLMSEDVFERIKSSLVKNPESNNYFTSGIPVYVLKNKKNYAVVCDKEFAEAMVRVEGKILDQPTRSV